MKLKVKDVARIMEQIAPSSLAESYDNVGLMVGDREAEVTNVLVALDCTMAVIEEAAQNKCNLILNHHPLLFVKPRTVTTDTLIGRKLMKLLKNDINVYASHTNLDSVSGGLNDIVTNLLGFSDYEIMEPSPLRNDGSGIGRLVTLQQPTTLGELCDRVKSSLNIPALRYCGDQNMTISRIAVINGSGGDFFDAARKMGAQCVITGDTSYHDVSDMVEENIGVIDAGHFDTEWPAMKVAASRLNDELKKAGYSNCVLLTKCVENPYGFK